MMADHPTVERMAARDAGLRRRQLRAQRGFTLVELIVSLTAGLLIAAAAFLLARNASLFFQREAGITTAQFASVVGMTRLQADLRRAAFMSSPRPDLDPLRCGDNSGWPQGLRDLAGVTIVNGGSVADHAGDHALSTLNGLSPDTLVLGGSFSTTEQFAVDVLSAGSGGGLLLQLQENGAMVRTRLSAPDATTFQDKMSSIFRVGGFIRIVDDEGRYGFGVVSGVDTTGPRVRISVAANPALPTRSSAVVCGCQGFCTGSLVNPISRVRYDLRRIDPAQHPAYAALYRRAGFSNVSSYHRGLPEVARTELVRVELDATGAEIPESLELVSEYAVDLKFGVTAEVPQNPPQPVPVLQRFPVGHATVYDIARPIAAGGTPERIRAVQVRLSVRNADRDRDQNLVLPTPDGGLFRYNLGVDRGFARMRTLIADVSLPNQTRMLP